MTETTCGVATCFGTPPKFVIVAAPTANHSDSPSQHPLKQHSERLPGSYSFWFQAPVSSMDNLLLVQQTQASELRGGCRLLYIYMLISIEQFSFKDFLKPKAIFCQFLLSELLKLVMKDLYLYITD